MGQTALLRQAFQYHELIVREKGLTMQMTKVLDVPYLVQPTAITCQSTCLSMFAQFLEKKLMMSTPAGGVGIQEIWAEINTSRDRPAQERNSYQNMRWWLEKYFTPPFQFEVKSTKNVDEAILEVVAHIDKGFPVMVSTNHERTDGHIILVIGYEGYTPGVCDPNVRFVCHDPYGKFGPQLHSKLYGKRRFEGGMSLQGGGQVGPGKAVQYDYQGIKRIRSDKHSTGTYYLVSAKV
jgi:hypothetical protein